MKTTDKRLKISAWLIGCLLCFIWGNSLLPGEISGRISDAVKEFLAFLLPGEVPGVTTGGGLLRKIAHFTEFAALGPDRGPSLRDVAIDTCGAAAGIGLLLLGYTIVKKIKHSKENKTL